MVSNSSPLLINESPLQVLPSLAKALGNAEEAIILQQIQYWINNPKSGRVGEDGRKYIRDTYQEWLIQFPWMNERTLKRRIKSLEDKKLILTANLNKSSYDRTKWYAIDYDELNKYLQMEGDNLARSIVSNCHDEKGQSDTIKDDNLTQPIPKTSSKTSSETSTKNNSSSKDEHIPYSEIIEYLNKKTNKNFDYDTPAYRRIIRGRWHDKKRKGLTIEQKLSQFKKVIDNKSFDWQEDKVMWKYMRPSTLFAVSHFDEYLNENNIPQQPTTGGYEELLNKPNIQDIPDSDLPF